MLNPNEDIAQSVVDELYAKLIHRRNLIGIVGPPMAKEIEQRAKLILMIAYQIQQNASEMAGRKKEGKRERCHSVRVLTEKLLVAVEDLEQLL